LQLVERFWVCW